MSSLGSELLNKNNPLLRGKEELPKRELKRPLLGKQRSRASLGTGAATFTEPLSLENWPTKVCLPIYPLLPQSPASPKLPSSSAVSALITET